jgi:hypothetical protein
VSKEKRDPRIIAAAIAAAIQLYMEEETKTPPFIILPHELRTTTSPWRFVGRKDIMDGRSFVQMKFLKR